MKYICDPHIVPSVVPADLDGIVHAAERFSFAHALHLDIDDGVFESAQTWPYLGAGDVAALTSVVTRFPGTLFEAHLMVSEPKELGERLARAGCQSVAGHIEAFATPHEATLALKAWKDAGARTVGLVFKIETPLSVLNEVHGFDFVHLMSIAQIGAQGEPFDDRILSRVEELHAQYPDLLVAVDGGISEATAETLARAGANRLIVGHVLSESENPERTYADMWERAMRGCQPIKEQMTV